MESYNAYTSSEWLFQTNEQTAFTLHIQLVLYSNYCEVIIIIGFDLNMFNKAVTNIEQSCTTSVFYNKLQLPGSERSEEVCVCKPLLFNMFDSQPNSRQT